MNIKPLKNRLLKDVVKAELHESRVRHWERQWRGTFNEDLYRKFIEIRFNK